MNRIDRLFGILTLLQSRKYVSAERISEQFEISVRTVYRDVKALGESGIPISFEPHKGYFIVPGFFLSPVAFSTEEANALLLSESLVSGFADKSIQGHMTSALTKVKTVLKASQKTKIEQLEQSMKMQLPARLLSETDYLAIVQQAITSAQQLELTYTNFKEEPSERRIEPIGLVFYAFSWHVIGWCHLRNDYRDFKLSRITGLKLLTRTFEKDPHISLGDYQLPVNY